MPKYYDMGTTGSATTDGTTQTEAVHLAMLTTASGNVVRITQVLAQARHTTAGGAAIRIKHTGGLFSGGGAITPTPRQASTGAQAAAVSCFSTGSALTAGTAPVIRQQFGFAQTGGTGGWTAVEPDDAIQLLPKTTSTFGNAEFHSIAIGTAVPFGLSVEFSES